MAEKGLKFSDMLKILKESLGEIPEHRRGRNRYYEIADAGLAAFAVFFMQSPSFLAYQQDMERRRGRNNARSLFGVEQIPSDGQIRNLLDPVEPIGLGAPSGACMRDWSGVAIWEAIGGWAAPAWSRWMARSTSPPRSCIVPTVG